MAGRGLEHRATGVERRRSGVQYAQGSRFVDDGKRCVSQQCAVDKVEPCHFSANGLTNRRETTENLFGESEKQGKKDLNQITTG